MLEALRGRGGRHRLCWGGALSAAAMGYALVGTILALTVVRFVAFCMMDSKGI